MSIGPMPCLSSTVRVRVRVGVRVRVRVGIRVRVRVRVRVTVGLGLPEQHGLLLAHVADGRAVRRAGASVDDEVDLVGVR
eukprot:scaffold43527_cov55-Phaeocystis_antarctica.AAC.1